jgi:hypothetical protein
VHDLPGSGERCVPEVAIRSGTPHILTGIFADRRVPWFAPFDLDAIDTDEFPTRSFDHFPAAPLAVLQNLREVSKTRCFSPPELTLALTVKGLHKRGSLASQSQLFS